MTEVKHLPAGGGAGVGGGSRGPGLDSAPFQDHPQHQHGYRSKPQQQHQQALHAPHAVPGGTGAAFIPNAMPGRSPAVVTEPSPTSLFGAAYHQQPAARPEFPAQYTAGVGAGAGTSGGMAHGGPAGGPGLGAGPAFDPWQSVPTGRGVGRHQPKPQHNQSVVIELLDDEGEEAAGAGAAPGMPAHQQLPPQQQRYPQQLQQPATGETSHSSAADLWGQALLMQGQTHMPHSQYPVHPSAYPSIYPAAQPHAQPRAWQSQAHQQEQVPGQQQQHAGAPRPTQQTQPATGAPVHAGGRKRERSSSMTSDLGAGPGLPGSYQNHTDHPVGTAPAPASVMAWPYTVAAWPVPAPPTQAPVHAAPTQQPQMPATRGVGGAMGAGAQGMGAGRTQGPSAGVGGVATVRPAAAAPPAPPDTAGVAGSKGKGRAKAQAGAKIGAQAGVVGSGAGAGGGAVGGRGKGGKVRGVQAPVVAPDPFGGSTAWGGF